MTPRSPPLDRRTKPVRWARPREWEEMTTPNTITVTRRSGPESGTRAGSSQRSPSSQRSWSWRWWPASSPTRWRCSPTPATCSPTCSAWAWPWPRSSSPAEAANAGTHVRPVPAGDPRRPRQRGAAVRRGDLRARRGGPALRRPTRRAERPDAGRRAGSGSVANLVAFFLLRSGAQESINVEGAVSRGAGRHGRIVRRDRRRHRHRHHGMGLGRPDRRRGHRPVDPAADVAARARRRCGSWSRRHRRDWISSPSSPALPSIEGVVDVHDLHVWTLTSEMEVASAHLRVDAGPTAIPCSTRRGRCCRSDTTSLTPRSRSNPRTTRAATRSPGRRSAP